MLNLQVILNVLAILLGWWLSSIEEFIVGALLSLSAGIFLAISITHILNEEFSNKKYLCSKFAAVVLATLLA